MLDLIIIVVYFAVVVTIGIFSRKAARDASGFFVASRRSSTPWIAGSLVATIIGGSATVGMAGLGFSRGLTGAWWLLVGSIGLVVLGLFFAERVRKFGLYTLPQLIGKQYGRNIALAASILIVIAWLGVLAGQIVAAGQILSVLKIGTPILWMVIFNAVLITYTLLGGQYAVIQTDVLQTGMIFTGIFVGLAQLLSRLGGFGGLVNSLPPAKLSFPLSPTFGGYELVSYLLLIGLTYVVGPDMYSRLFSARDAKTARNSVFWAALLIAPLAFAITLMGMGASILFPNISPEQAFPALIQGVFPPVVGAIVLAAVVSAIMSPALLLTASTILSNDIITKLRPSLNEKQVVLISRWGVVVLGILSLLLALTLKGVINALLFAYTIYTCGLILPVIAGFYRDRLKLTPMGALVAIIGGGTAGLISKLGHIKYLDLGGLLISGLLLFLVSFIDNRIRSRRLDEGKGA
jgi:SSS family solute:Na+ symporter